MNILIADDDRSFTHLLSTFLKAKGYSVTVASDAMQALQAVMRSLPDAIILDIVMPGGSGVDMLKRLKTSTKTNKIPVIVVTGSADASLPKTVKNLGADEFLRKPLNFEPLHQMLSKLLGGPAEETVAQPAAYDSLPGIVTHGAIAEILGAELARASREGTPVGVIVLVLDDFKRIKKIHGPQTGEAILREATRRIQSSIRPYDTTSRRAEEELLIIMPGCDASLALKHAQRFETLIRGEAMETAEGKLRVTASLGVAASNRAKDVVVASPLRATDRALDRARKGGGSRVEMAESGDFA